MNQGDDRARPSMSRTIVLALGLLAQGGVLGCSSDGDEEPLAACSSSATPVDTTGCAAVLEATGDAGADYDSVQTALIEADSSSHVCLCPGTFGFDREVSLSVPEVTVRGLGASRDEVVLDFAAQSVGDDAFTVTSDGFTVENLWLKNSPGNGIVVTGAENVTFRNLKVSWDAGSVTENGAYAVYPVKSKRVIIEDSEVIGAADAGIYVGQCEEAIVRNNVVHGNVAGIEIENSTDSEVHGNESYDNTAGILVFVLPNLEKKDGMRCKVYDNISRDNNRPNFAEPGTVVAAVPPGLGMLLLAADNTEITDNRFENNVSTGIMMVSLATLAFLAPDAFTPDPETDPDPEVTFIHGNTFSQNGSDPQGTTAELGITPLEDLLWDGVEKGDVNNASAQLCLGSEPPSFRDFAVPAGITNPDLHSTDTTPYECTLPELSPLSW
jgi:parallel beta-helix repeat protein